MKRQFFFNSALIAAVLLLAAACRKPQVNIPPEPDTEFQSSVDVSYAALVISDIEMMCGFVGEGDNFPKFYKAVQNSNPTLCSQGPLGSNYVFVSFNNTKCADGRVRDGSIYMYYGFTNPNAIQCHDYEFEGRVALVGYKVDGWDVKLKNTFLITNKLTSPVFNPAQTNLSWSLNGDFVLTYRPDTNKKIHSNVNLVKTLINASDKNVFDPSKVIAINWPLALVKYNGSMFGETSGNVPFKYSINDANPLLRDFTCSPDKAAGVNQVEEFHPFKEGRVSFEIGDLYPRDISYGNEQSTYHDVKNAPLELTPQCDNKGIITIKGISYPVDFAKEYK